MCEPPLYFNYYLYSNPGLIRITSPSLSNISESQTLNIDSSKIGKTNLSEPEKDL